MITRVSSVGALFLTITVSAAQAQTPAILPGPETTEPTVMEAATDSVQTVRIIDDKLFPPKLYARLDDTIRFENRSSINHIVSSNDGSWTSGEILPGEFYEVAYKDFVETIYAAAGDSSVDGNLCNDFLNNGNANRGRTDGCLVDTAYSLDTGDVHNTITPRIAHVQTNGDLNDSASGWNAHHLVVPF